ncbi:MAG TPA: MBL fold metallo-hydrolase [Acidobacteriota bacterium]|nr:MBL fold metallo-hydrolase [Acidobacteriota bacterium]
MTPRSLFILIAAFGLGVGAAHGQTVGQPLAPWTEGTLDIHQINTGRGNSALLVFPDGTTLLVDAGALAARTERHVPPRPDESHSPGESISRYIKRFHPKGEAAVLDYALLTHFHGDHMGGINGSSRASSLGPYKLSGITEVAEYVPIARMLDRGWPDYDYPSPLTGATIENYKAFLKWQEKHRGMTVERLRPGRKDQIRLVNSPEKYPNFEIVIVMANGEVWTGVGTATRQHFPPLAEIKPGELPSENACSAGFRLSYGAFDYFSGGDIPGIPEPGAPNWHDVETPVAKAVGPVEVSVLNHHGYIDSQNSFFLNALRPRTWILPVWDSAHPTPSVYNRLRSPGSYPGPRDLFMTNMHPANRIVTPGLAEVTSHQGHIVVRVSPGGESYKVIILDDSGETYQVTAVHGPFQTR